MRKASLTERDGTVHYGRSPRSIVRRVWGWRAFLSPPASSESVFEARVLRDVDNGDYVGTECLARVTVQPRPKRRQGYGHQAQ